MEEEKSPASLNISCFQELFAAQLMEEVCGKKPSYSVNSETEKLHLKLYLNIEIEDHAGER